MDMRARAPSSSVYVRAERSEWAKERGEGTTVTWQASGRLFAGRLFAGRLVAGGGSGQGTGDDRRTSARGGKRSALVSHTLLGASARTSAPQLGRRASLANVYTCGQECSAGPHGPVTAASAAQANRGGLALARSAGHAQYGRRLVSHPRPGRHTHGRTTAARVDSISGGKRERWQMRAHEPTQPRLVGSAECARGAAFKLHIASGKRPGGNLSSVRPAQLGQIPDEGPEYNHNNRKVGRRSSQQI